MLYPSAFHKTLAMSTVLAALLLAGCASTMPGQGPVPAAAETWTKPGATLQDTQQALQVCNYVDRFSIGTKAIAGQLACMNDKGFTFNAHRQLKREHCVAPEMPAGCAVYWHTLNR